MYLSTPTPRIVSKQPGCHIAGALVEVLRKLVQNAVFYHISSPMEVLCSDYRPFQVEMTKESAQSDSEGQLRFAAYLYWAGVCRSALKNDGYQPCIVSWTGMRARRAVRAHTHVSLCTLGALGGFSSNITQSGRALLTHAPPYSQTPASPSESS